MVNIQTLKIEMKTKQGNILFVGFLQVIKSFVMTYVELNKVCS